MKRKKWRRAVAGNGFHAGVRRSGIGGADGKHGLYEYTHTQLAYIQT